jgi:CheY-like chemotaxis protein
LPRLIVDASQSGRQNADSDAPQEASPLRLMVVDDNEDAAAMLAMLLEASGHQVIVEHRSPQALERARKEVPQVCLLDIGLPEMDGLELARRLRAQPETAHVLLIAVTGYGQDQDRKETLAAGFDHHLVKPVDMEKLAAILAERGRA